MKNPFGRWCRTKRSPHEARKELVRVNLKKGDAKGAKARIVFVLDKSGSMDRLFSNGTVARVLERLTAVADVMDDDHTMQVFAFATTACQLPDVTAKTAKGYLKSPKVVEALNGLGRNNVEPLVMDLVMDEYLRDNPSDVPTFVLFFSDGGIGAAGWGYRGDVNQHIEDRVVASSHYNLYWQFVGLGNGNFGKLAKLDQLTTGLVDNAGFFQVNDIDQLSDEKLFSRLLTGFPRWLRVAKAAGIRIAS